MEKKIFIGSGQDIKKTLELIKTSSAEKIILNIANDSPLKSSIRNFEILKKESRSMNKEIVVESVDDHILELAALAEIEAINPVFRLKRRAVSDIVSGSGAKSQIRKKEEPVKIQQKEEQRPVLKPQKRSFNFKKILFVVLLLVIIGGGIVFANITLPKAEIFLTVKRSTAAFSEKIVADIKTLESIIGETQILLPAELVTSRRNADFIFEAHGKKMIETKAKGKLIIRNSYSSSPQVLVAGTRFESPQKKIFHLDEKTVVPGAQVVAGKINPSQIEVAVTANEAGDDYNITPSKEWRIVGFKGTPKYDGFTAESILAMTGGFKGERNEPTEEDLNKARTEIKKIITDSLKSQFLILNDDRFKFLEGAENFKILKEEIKNVDNKKFNLFSEGELRRLVFEETALKNSLIDKISKNQPPPFKKFQIKDFKINYSSSTVNWEEGKLYFITEGSLVFEPLIDINVFKREIMNKNEKELRRAVFSLEGVEKANVSLWPFWVYKVPANLSKIKITIY